MRASLARWIGDADALRHLEHFRVDDTTAAFAHVRTRADDYFLSLVGELFERMRSGYTDATHWARLGNALALFADTPPERLNAIGVSGTDAALFAAAAFYSGGFSASAYVTVRYRRPPDGDGIQRACFDLLRRPATVDSAALQELLGALRSGQVSFIEALEQRTTAFAETSLARGPTEWISARLLQQLLTRFKTANVRAVLPEGTTAFWTPLISSFLDRTPPTWEFFPSQIQAIRGGLLDRSETFSLQMPTGAGKTTLCETLLFSHLARHPADAAILLVPYRSLASELRGSLVKHLNAMGISARCAYGGTVPSGSEVHALDETRAMVATPEALSGLLSADRSFLRRISLVVCDEGHLLDGGERGVGLELLLARLRSREGQPPRFVFVSAIVPNIEEINAWLGGSADSVIRSDYRPALAEFAVLRSEGPEASAPLTLEMHPHEPAPARFSISGFLARRDFAFFNPRTKRTNTYKFTSISTRAIATARKALPMGSVAVFAANKRGDQGAVGLAQELIEQLAHQLPLPEPMALANNAKVTDAVRYLEDEYGPDWIGTKTLASGAVLHHGDVPQETREVVEKLLRREDVRLAICTSTLAEGVNLPIRTLVLYSVQRRRKGGVENLLARDIKNLVGRAGRAGATTKGLVVCANEKQWPLVAQVANQAPGEPVTGALRQLMQSLRSALALSGRELTNGDLEATPWLHALIDGIDATLIDLAAEEIGEEELVKIAVRIADETFASRQATESASKVVLQNVFELRARRVVGIRSAGRLGWIRETGCRARMLDAVESGLLPKRSSWDDVTDPIDPMFVAAILEWAWSQKDLQDTARDAYRLEETDDVNSIRDSFFETVVLWLSGARFRDIASRSGRAVDDLLGIHSQLVTFALQTTVEQAIAVLAKLVEAQGKVMAPGVAQFPDHLRFGVPTPLARSLVAAGVRHRRAAIELGSSEELRGASPDARTELLSRAHDVLTKSPDYWRTRLGELVFESTLADVAPAGG